MKYVFHYDTLVNREYNIYREIIINPFIFSYLGIFDPNYLKDIIKYTKEKSPNMLENVIPGSTITTEMLVGIYRILTDYKFFETEEFGLYSGYVDKLLASSKVEKVYIVVKEIDPVIEEQVIVNIRRRFQDHTDLEIITMRDSFISEALINIEWDMVSVRDVEQVIELVNSDVNIKGKDIVIDEAPYNKLDPVNYIVLNEKDAKIDYRAMI